MDAWIRSWIRDYNVSRQKRVEARRKLSRIERKQYGNSQASIYQRDSKCCKNHPGYPLNDGIAEFIMGNLNITPSQSELPREPYMLEISVCEGRVDAFVGTGELIEKGAQMISVQCPALIFYTERNSSIGR